MALKTFSSSTNYKNFKLPSGNSPGTPQSMCILDNDQIVVFHNKGNANKGGYLIKYTSKGKVSGSDVWISGVGHGSGMTYCNKNGLIYITCGSGKMRAYNKNFKKMFDFTLSTGASAVAYDKSTNLFYVGTGYKMRVYTYDTFQNNGWSKSKRKPIKTFSITHACQDCGAYNGVVYSCMYKNIALYNHTNGKKLGTIQINTYPETESVVFDSNGYFIYLTAQNRGIHWTKWRPQYKDGNLVTSTPSVPNKTGTAAAAFVATAKNEVGTKEKNGTNNVKYNTWYYGHEVSNAPGGDKYAWCAVFVAWCAKQALGNNNVIPKNASAGGIQEAIVSKGGAWVLKGSFAKNATSAAKCKPGDIFTVDPNHNSVADHVGIIVSVNGDKFSTVEGNHGDKVDATSRKIGEIFRVCRPKWPDGSFTMPGGYSAEEGYYGEEGGQMGPFAHPEQLYSSATYDYVDEKEETEEEKNLRELRERYKQIFENINVNNSFKRDAPPDIVLPSIRSASSTRKPKTRFEGEVSGSPLPSTINYVEAPYVKMTLGGVEFGTYDGGKYPNYIQGIDVRKTNGSMNEYTINLIHQVSPGDNPNYIENLISKNGFNKVEIEYGDAEAGIAYRSVNALLIDVKSKYDFFNSSISYTLHAISSSVMSAVDRRNYPAVKDKPSNIINKMLYETGELLKYFPAMISKTLVSSNNCIPTNDKEVEMDAMTNTTPLNYLNKLVSSMVSTTSQAINDSIYYLNINDENALGPFFTISEVSTKMNKSMFPLIYEIDINYPDEKSLAYNFSVDTDFSWPLAYEYAGGFSNYDYGINNSGKTFAEASNAAIKTTTGTTNSFIKDKNWWTNVTEFPIKATLEVKGLTSYVLLLNYIKVNVYYFGNKRDSSGIYIVTGQEDMLSGNGFRTKLELTRVAGDNQYIAIDGRVLS